MRGATASPASNSTHISRQWLSPLNVHLSRKYGALSSSSSFTYHKIRHLHTIHRLQECIWLNQPRLMKDLGYPQDIVALVRNIYSQSTTTFTWEHFGKTQPIPIQIGTIQGDTLSPYLFNIFHEPLLKWLQIWNNEYSFITSNTKIKFATYAYDLAILANKVASL